MKLKIHISIIPVMHVNANNDIIKKTIFQF